MEAATKPNSTDSGNASVPVAATTTVQQLAAASEAASACTAAATPLETSEQSGQDTSHSNSGLSETVGSSEQSYSLSKPTRRELLEALQQHLDVLDQRGQVSAVIPGFLRREHTNCDIDKKPKANTTESNTSSNSSTEEEEQQQYPPPTKISRQSASAKNQYYEDLAKEMERIPEVVNFNSRVLRRQRCKRQSAAQSSTESESDISGLNHGTESSNNDDNGSSSESASDDARSPSKKRTKCSECQLPT